MERTEPDREAARCGETVVVVSHNFPILGIICRITGTHLNNYRNFHLDPCGVTRISCNGDDQWEVTCINNQEYPGETKLPRWSLTDAAVEPGVNVLPFLRIPRRGEKEQRQQQITQ